LKFQSGFVTIIGRPNVGKSTLMNNIIGEKIAIMSNKPQTTRNRIQSILTREQYQIIFIDTPGIHKAKNKLGEFMAKSVETTLNEVDMILMLVEPVDRVLEADRYVIEQIKNIKTPVTLVINKMDTIEKSKLLKVIDVYKEIYDFHEIIPISALNGENVDTLLENIRKKLPEGPQYFPGDMITDQPERQIVAELVREKALQLLEDEIPHGIAVEIMSMKNRNDKNIVDIEATIYCEKESHKGIVIGKSGSKLKQIGTKARIDIQNLLGSQVNIQLWVKVKKDWRDNDFLLKNFGYNSKEI
jgi:GTP-binding protein Era